MPEGLRRRRLRSKIYPGNIVWKAKLVIVRSKLPKAVDAYTAAQRTVIDRLVAMSLKQCKRGRRFGPFESAEELVGSQPRSTRARWHEAACDEPL